MIFPPHSQIGPITPEQRAEIIRTSVIAGVYETTSDRESAYEKLKGKVSAAPAARPNPLPGVNGAPASPPVQQSSATTGSDWLQQTEDMLGTVLGSGTGRSGRGDTVVQAMAKSAARSIGSTVGRQIVRGVLGSILGSSRR